MISFGCVVFGIIFLIWVLSPKKKTSQQILEKINKGLPKKGI